MVRAEGEHRVVIVAGLPVHHYSVTDAMAEAYAMVVLVDGGYATQKEVAVAFGSSDRTVRRHQGRDADGGMRGSPPGPVGGPAAGAFRASGGTSSRGSSWTV